MERVSIYEAAGGWNAFLALASAHHTRCLADPVLEHPFSHGLHADHVDRLAAYWAEVFGGPQRFSTEFGGHSAMMTIHAGQGMQPDLGERFVACFAAAADDAGLPADPELRSALRAYMEWATSAMYAYNAREAQVPPGLPMPRWGWMGLESSRDGDGTLRP
jgi:hemoglobin